MIAGVILFGGVAGLLHPQTGKYRFQLALELEEGLLLTVGAEHQHLRLLGQGLALYGQVDFGDLIELCGLVVIGVVPAQDL